MHAFHGVVAQGRVAGVSGPPPEGDGLDHDPLVHDDGLQARRFADDGMAAQALFRVDQGLGAGHGAFFVAGCQQDDGTFYLFQVEGLQYLHHDREKAFHIRRSQTVKTAVFLRQPEGVLAPRGFVVRHRIGMPGQHQAASAFAEARHQVDLVRPAADGHGLDTETQVGKPVRKQLYRGKVALVMARVDAAHRRRRHQRGERLFE